MPSTNDHLQVHVFSTTPQSADFEEGKSYLKKVEEIAGWSEKAGCKGILIYTDNRLIDPWLVAQLVIQSTERLCPLVATQPVYMHPYSVAKMVTSFSYLYQRQIYLNMVAGGFRTDLLALGDPTPHDSRYDRLREYTGIIRGLLANSEAVTFKGEFYQVENLHLKPPMSQDLQPGIFVSGSSEAGRKTAEALGATAIEYPRPSGEYAPAQLDDLKGIRIGIIADDDHDRAWQEAYRRFPPDRKGELTHKLAMKVSDSAWHKQLAELDRAVKSEARPSLYWLWPFKNYKTFCPYIVGSFDEVAAEVSKYITAGFKNFILDIPARQDDLEKAGEVFRRAVEMVESSNV